MTFPGWEILQQNKTLSAPSSSCIITVIFILFNFKNSKHCQTWLVQTNKDTGKAPLCFGMVMTFPETQPLGNLKEKHCLYIITSHHHLYHFHFIIIAHLASCILHLISLSFHNHCSSLIQAVTCLTTSCILFY